MSREQCKLWGKALFVIIIKEIAYRVPETYSDKENARSFLTNYLPEKVLNLVDMSALEISMAELEVL